MVPFPLAFTGPRYYGEGMKTITWEQFAAAARRQEQGITRLGDLAILRAVALEPNRLVTRGWWSL